MQFHFDLELYSCRRDKIVYIFTIRQCAGLLGNVSNPQRGRVRAVLEQGFTVGCGVLCAQQGRVACSLSRQLGSQALISSCVLLVQMEPQT